jgi:hypothetical protein
MSQEDDWYRQLAASDRLIVEARKHVEDATAQISSLERQRRATLKAVARLQLFEQTLQWMLVHRDIVLKQLRARPSPE